MLTGESWSEVIARPLVYGTDDNHAPSSNAVIASIFFVVFLLLNSIVLINVVVAVLLEKMVDETPVRRGLTCSPPFPPASQRARPPPGASAPRAPPSATPRATRAPRAPRRLTAD